MSIQNIRIYILIVICVMIALYFRFIYYNIFGYFLLEQVCISIRR